MVVDHVSASETPIDLETVVAHIPFVRSAREAEAALKQLEVLSRRVDAAKALLAAQIDRHDLHRTDGYITMSSWVRSVARLSGVEASHFTRAGRLISAYPAVGPLYYSGVMGREHLRRLSTMHANKRIASELSRFMPLFLEWATHMDVDVFTSATLRWEQLADADGSHRHCDEVHESRDALVSTFGDATHIQGVFGNLQGSLLHEVHDRFCQRELQQDLDQRDRLGLPDLPRTSRQRRADALLNIFAAAANTLPPTVEPLVNILIDADTYESALRAIENDEPLPSLAGSPSDFARRRCETIGGALLSPIDVAVASLVGTVRRVVVDSSSTVIDLGRRSRLFTGSAREAVFVRGRRCIWPGCCSRHTQADHLTPWSKGGTTSPVNGAPLCARHNRLKNDGYSTTRLTDGRFEVVRPEGEVVSPV